MKKWIVLSVNCNEDYAYFLPITCWTWRKAGFEPIINFVGLESWKFYDLVMGYCNCDVLLFQSIDGVRDATIAQVSRLYSSLFENINPYDYVMMGDSDMLALGNHWNSNVEGVTVWNYDLTGFTEIPMCFVGMPKHLWLQVFNLDSVKWDSILKRDIENYPNAKSEDFYKWWGCDQQILTQRLNEYGKDKITFINRGQGSHGYARGRVDRGSGGWVLNQPELIDAHLEQQTWQNDAKVKRLYELLAHVWPDQDFSWFHKYTDEFRKLAV